MNVEWEIINPGRILLGTNNRTILFGGIGPRHEVKIDYQFEICKYPLKKEICEKLLLEGCEIASESEWFLALNQNKIFGNNEIEEFSDRINNSYWGKICDGSPFISDDWIFRLGCEWKSGKNNIIQIEKENDEVEYPRLVRTTKKISTKQQINILPSSSNKTQIFTEEILICILVGIIPSFIWAYFNASSNYIYEGWLNLLFGGLFFGFSTIIFWRPPTKTWMIEDVLNTK